MSEYTGPPGHRIRVGRSQKGMTPIRPSRPTYRTNASCSCGQWKSHDNRAPSKGGRTSVEQDHRLHVAADTDACPVAGCDAATANDHCSTPSGRDHAARNRTRTAS